MQQVKNGYATRSYNLVAGRPQTLPAAREFLIISASVDITAIGYALGDENGDLEQWPYGFAVGVKEGSTRARIQSTVNQTVVVAMVSGNAIVIDSRFAPGAGSLAVTITDGADGALGATADAPAASDDGAATLIALIKRGLEKDNNELATTATDAAVVGSALASTVIVAAGTNVNGVKIHSVTISCLADPTALFRIMSSGAPLFEAQDSQNLAAIGPLTVPAGQSLDFQRTGGGRMAIAFTIL